MPDNYYRPEFQARTQAVQYAPGEAPATVYGLGASHLCCLLAGAVIGMLVMRWMHRG